MKALVKSFHRTLRRVGRLRNAALLVALALAPVFAAQTRPNHLDGQAAPYLKRAVSQPVDWYPWGADAFKRARELSSPILLDMGAVWCGWCDLMDRESYNRPELVAFINANFVAVKIDYDTQPQLAAEL